MRVRLGLFFLVWLLGGPLAHGQGSGAPARDREAFKVTKSVSGVVQKVDEAEGVLILLDPETEKEWILAVDDTTVFDGLEVKDLRKGIRLRIGYVPLEEEGVDGLAAKIRLIE